MQETQEDQEEKNRGIANIKALIKDAMTDYTKTESLTSEGEVFPGKMNVQQWVKKVEDTLKEIKTVQNPFHIDSLIRETQDTLYKLQNKFHEILMEFKDIKKKRLLRLYTNGEIKDMFAASGLLLKNVATHFNVSEPAASRYINGDIQDLVIRDHLFEYFKKAYDERRAKDASS